MTTRYFGTFALFLAMSACGGDKDTADDGDTDVDGDTDTDADSDADSDTDADVDSSGETGETGGDFFVPAGMAVSATFGWDQDSQSFVDAISDGTPIPSGVYIQLGDEEWATSAAAGGASCYVVIPVTSPVPVPDWVSSDPLIAFGAAADPAAAFTSCNEANGFPLDPASGNEADFVAFWASSEWGVGVGQLRDEADVPDMEALAQAAADGFVTDLANVFGGTIHNTFLTSPQGDQYYVALANEIDADYNILPTFISGNAIAVPGGGVATGSYNIVTNVFWTFTQQ